MVSARHVLFAGLVLGPSVGLADSGTDNLRAERLFQVKAEVAAGCLLGSGAGDTSNFGLINFGQISSLPAALDRVSTPSQGSILLQCTPGTALTIALGSGANSSNVAAGRYLARGSERLRYQLYKDNAFSSVWGDGANGASALSTTFTATTGIQAFPVFARLFSVTPMPSAGVYTDVVTVTVSY